ncbi:hypothetical protein Bca52824_028484 [Brassica carinata]|uniref:Uncharacterized protein n=1 Tax=Brassica carinata TaxID=52824 RepID=A0A8X7VCJ0_BRACI|nr:hypothetical protein Bca52824_028484 [Brassica carinata]
MDVTTSTASTAPWSWWYGSQPRIPAIFRIPLSPTAPTIHLPLLHPLPLGSLPSSAPVPPGPPVMRVRGVGSTAGRDHLPYLTPFNRSGSGISMDQPYDVLGPRRWTFDFHSLPNRQAARVQLEFDEALFIYHHFVHKVMDNYGKQIHEWKKKWKSIRRPLFPQKEGRVWRQKTYPAEEQESQTREQILQDIDKATQLYLSCDDPTEAAARRLRVLAGDASGQVEETVTTMLAGSDPQADDSHKTHPLGTSSQVQSRDLIMEELQNVTLQYTPADPRRQQQEDLES